MRLTNRAWCCRAYDSPANMLFDKELAGHFLRRTFRRCRRVIHQQKAALEAKVWCEDFMPEGLVQHVFLDAEIIDREIEVEGSGQIQGQESGAAMKAGVNVIDDGKCHDLFEKHVFFGVK